MASKQVRIAAIGLGNRTGKYLHYVHEHPDVVKLVAVVEPDKARLAVVKEKFGLSDRDCYDSIETFKSAGPDIDACIVGTPDFFHYDLTMHAIGKGWKVLLEKPMAQTAEECLAITEASTESEVLVSVCYVLRYSPYFMKMKELVGKSQMGKVRFIRHIERVGCDRTAHSYVRGPWNVQEMNTTVFLSKCCHDVDFVLWLIGNDISTVRSYGSEKHFAPANAPEGASRRCVDCRLERQCRYSAVDLYLRRRDWIKGFLPRPGETKEDAIVRALAESRYGRCVYDCPTNDVIDRQVVEIEMTSGIKAEIVMECLTENDNRTTYIDLENAVIEGDEAVITVNYKDGSPSERYDFSWCRGLDFHAGADLNIVEDFLAKVSDGNTEARTSAGEAVVSHLVCFMAERSRAKSGEPEQWTLARR